MLRDLRKLPTDRVLVSPSVLASDFSCLGGEIVRAAQAGADVIHLDVMDGGFVPNLSFGPPVIRSIRPKSELLFDTHLMIEHPAKYAAAFAAAGADHLTFHLECSDPAGEVIDAIRKAGCTVGISLKPATPPEAVFPWLEKIDLVLVMTVEPGFGGQSLKSEALSKMRGVRALLEQSRPGCELEVDGGVNVQTAPLVVDSGASVLVAGNAVFSKADRRSAIRELRMAADIKA